MRPTTLGLDVGDHWTTAFSATWEGTNTLPTLAFGNYLHDRRRRRATTASSSGPRRTATATTHRSRSARATARCRCCSATGSRSGRRDLRMSNDRHYYTRRRASSCGGSTPGEAPREYTEADGWRPLQIWGMGIASLDLTGDGHPEVFLTSQGDNKLQTLEDGHRRGRHTATSPFAAGVTAQRPFAGGDVLPSTAWHPEFADVNNDGLHRPVRHQGKRRGAARLRVARSRATC